MLIILDNCDQFLKHNKNCFDINIEYLQNRYDSSVLQIVFISEEKIVSSQFLLQAYHVERFSKLESLLYVQMVN